MPPDPHAPPAPDPATRPGTDPAEFAPLSGVRILDFTRVLAGPYATMVLAELGAQVIKVELPGTGDETRGWGPPFVDGASAYFHAVNRGKQSVTLDLATARGRRDVRRLAASVDVVVENFRPGVTERLGIDADTLMAADPGLVYASITGFGSVGPMAETAGTEVIVEAESGLMSITGLADGEPVRFGVAMVDIATGISAVNGILGALIHRQRSGRGRRIEVSLYATALSALGTVIATEDAGPGNAAPGPWGSAHPSIVPYRAYAARDGHVVIGAINDGMWRRLWPALGRPAVADRQAWADNARRVGDRAAVDAAVAAAVAEWTVEQVTARLSAHRVLVAPVKTVGAAAAGAQAQALGQVVRDDAAATYVRSPLHAAGTRRLGPAPALGADTDEVLDELRVLAERGALLDDEQPAPADALAVGGGGVGVGGTPGRDLAADGDAARGQDVPAHHR